MSFSIILLGVVVCGLLAGVLGIKLRTKYMGHSKEDKIVDYSMFGAGTGLFIAWCLIFS